MSYVYVFNPYSNYIVHSQTAVTPSEFQNQSEYEVPSLMATSTPSNSPPIASPNGSYQNYSNSQSPQQIQPASTMFHQPVVNTSPVGGLISSDPNTFYQGSSDHTPQTASSESEEMYGRVFVGGVKHNEKYCPKTNNLLFKTTYSGRLYLFHFDPISQSLVPHECLTCIDLVTEKDLSPLYAVQVSNGKYVIFMRNRIFNTVEQYQMTAPGSLEQIENSNVKYNPNTILPFLFTVFIENGRQVVIMKDEKDKKAWKKISYGEGKFEIPALPVKMLPSEDYGDCIGSCPLHRIRFCEHYRKDFIQLKVNGNVLKFMFDEQLGMFVSRNCSFCKVKITEEHLIPKYSVYHEKSQKSIIFCHNIETGTVEQYVFKTKTMSFEQVDHPELVYDNSQDIYEIIVNLNEKGRYLVIQNNQEGGFVKFLVSGNNKYIRLPPNEVKTIRIQKRRR
ncbi:unnamed protein product [Caenorhabditis brenneri]